MHESRVRLASKQRNDNLLHARQNRASLYQVCRIVATRERLVSRRKQRVRAIKSSDVPPDLRQARCSPQSEQARILPSRRCQSAFEQRLDLSKRDRKSVV